MIGSITGAYYSPYLYQMGRGRETQNTQPAPAVLTARRAAEPETPVQPVTPVKAASAEEAAPAKFGIPIREGADPVEMAVRMRIQYPGQEDADAQAAQNGEDAKGVAGVLQAVEEGKCQTCEERKYQDGSDDMGVSFQTPTRIDPSQVASRVRGHEMEHVSREQSKAQREDRKVVSQSVTLHTDICPECGKVYISGGTTRTTTMANPEPPAQEQTQDPRVPFSAVA